LKKRRVQTRARLNDRVKGSLAPLERRKREEALDLETQEQLRIGRKLILEYRETLEKLAKG
jgi:hypothetical protein